jgi:homocysteine S-methyltransferase
MPTDAPFSDGRLHLAWTGMETDLIFNRGLDLPGFASHPLVETSEGRGLLREAFGAQIDVARAHDLGVVLESPTWTASRDRGAEIGVDADTLARRNRAAIALIAELRAETDHTPVMLSANVGPRADAYAPAERMTAAEAEAYHAEQIGWLSHTAVDVISGYTFSYPEEGIGLVRAARARRLPAVLAWTVETDGRLPVGIPLSEAILRTDRETDGYALHHMINCAHPDHFAPVFDAAHGAPWLERLRGLVANASRYSHAELDAAKELDDGDPEELAGQLAALCRAHPRIVVLGGCCGTDMRHLRALARVFATEAG